MDDPWGSPWASSDATTKADPSPSPPKAPRAFFGPPSTLSPHSPWVDDDDAFDSWATPGEPEDATTLAAWATWSEPPSTSRPGSAGYSSPVALAGSHAASPGLKPVLSRSRNSSVFRQPSPDHWTVESPWNQDPQPLSKIANQNHEQDSENSATTTNEVTNQVDSLVSDQSHKSSPSDEATQLSQHGLHVHDIVLVGAETGGDDTAEERGDRGSPSQRTSYSSTGSEPGRDSPSTSVDDETDTRPTKKPSSKVSELVGLYDGLARAASEEPSEPHKLCGSRNESHEKSDELHNNGGTEQEDYGTYQNALDVTLQSTQDSSSPRSSDRSSTPKASFKDTVPLVDDSKAGEYRANVASKSSVPIQQLVEKFGVIKFPVDFAALENRFVNTLGSFGHTDRAPNDVPDHILTDSFGTVEERRTWYRISRYGSMRMHDYGDDENYRRANWQTSHLRLDTIKIVRRWMEEDSFGGKLASGGNKRASIFNWDMSAAPVSLDKIFARKPSSAHSRTSSAAQSRHTPASSVGSLEGIASQRRPTSASINFVQATSTTVSPIPSFVWNTHSTTPSSSLRHSLAIEDAKSDPYSPVATLHKQATSSKIEAVHGGHSDDDDDWGEMISSPTAQATSRHDGDPNRNMSSRADLCPQNISRQAGVENFCAAVPTPSVVDLVQRPGTAQEASDTRRSLDTFPASNSHSVREEDPWGSTDFSVFEMPSLPTAVPVPPIVQSTLTQQAPIARTRHDAPAHTVQVALRPVQNSSVTQESKIIHQILTSLPDLSYMLR